MTHQKWKETNRKNLSALRGSLKFTQAKIAGVLGIHPNAYQKMEYGTPPPYIDGYVQALVLLNKKGLLKEHIKNINA